MRIKEDVLFTIEEYTGHADMYIKPRDSATGPTDKLILMRDAHGPSRQILINRSIRQSYFGFPTGSYYLCFYAYTPYSAKITIKESDLQGYSDFREGVI